MKTAVDTSVLLDVLTASPKHGEVSREALRAAYHGGALIACDVVWAELRSHFDTTTSFTNAVETLGIRYDAMPDDAAELAGTLWQAYRRRGHRERIAADFLIGAHAKWRADALLTRNGGFYRDYFRGLKVVEPASRAG